MIFFFFFFFLVKNTHEPFSEAQKIHVNVKKQQNPHKIAEIVKK